jgi:hypothetical protein
MNTKRKRARIELSDMIDIPAASRQFFLSRKTLINWACAGRITRFKIGGKLLLSRKQLASMIREV